jgi:hypothetical protein
MKIRELLESTDKKPHVFLDLDGVQADFAGAVKDVIGMDRNQAKQKTEDEIERLAHSSPQAVREFFANLKQLPGGKKITDWLNKNSIPYTILSAPLRGPYTKASIMGKQEWLRKHTPQVVSNAIFQHDKHEYAMDGGKPNILIDDYGKKIAAWQQAGGIGIKHEDEYETPDAAERTIKRLEEIFFNKQEKNNNEQQ